MSAAEHCAKHGVAVSLSQRCNCCGELLASCQKKTREAKQWDRQTKERVLLHADLAYDRTTEGGCPTVVGDSKERRVFIGFMEGHRKLLTKSLSAIQSESTG
jgi:hypothetical protein